MHERRVIPAKGNQKLHCDKPLWPICGANCNWWYKRFRDTGSCLGELEDGKALEIRREFRISSPPPPSSSPTSIMVLPNAPEDSPWDSETSKKFERSVAENIPSPPRDRHLTPALCSKRPGEYLDPCQEAAARSLKCLHRNGGARDMCADYFQ